MEVRWNSSKGLFRYAVQKYATVSYEFTNSRNKYISAFLEKRFYSFTHLGNSYKIVKIRNRATLIRAVKKNFLFSKILNRFTTAIFRDLNNLFCINGSFFIALKRFPIRIILGTQIFQKYLDIILTCPYTMNVRCWNVKYLWIVHTVTRRTG